MAGKQDDLAKLSSLREQATELFRAGKLEEATLIAGQEVELSEKALGPDHPDTATALSDLAALYHARGDSERAISPICAR
jgi:Flp pilus assembly protein TadD